MTFHLVQAKAICQSIIALALLYVVGCSGTPPPKSTVEWIDPNEIQQGPTIHETLSEELLVRIKKIHKTFADVNGTPIEKWIDDFKRDLDPEGNIRIWEDMQVAYNSYCNDRDLPLATRKEVFKVVLMRSMMPDDDVLERLEFEHISKDDAKVILAAYPGKAKPIEVIRADR